VQNEESLAETDRASETLEQRLHRLEDAVAALQDTRQIEERLLERLLQQVRPGPPPQPPRPSEQVTAAPRPAPPPEPPPAPPPPPSSIDVTAKVIQHAPTVLRQAWLITDMLRELRAMVRMFFDVRYTVGWPARLTVLVLLPLILVSGWVMPFTSVPVFGALMVILDKVLDLMLAFFLYKVLSREAQRYLQAQAARYGGS
jgi:hypothetical protein